MIFFATVIHLRRSAFAQVPTSVDSPKLQVSVPFIGCKADGQVGPEEAPNGETKIVSIEPKLADRLAYYKSQRGFGVLAPRGWYCFGTYGSNGDGLFVSPQAIDIAQLFSTTWKGFTGPVIQISQSYGDTPGRFAVASAIARVFPAYKEFVSKVIKEGIEPADSFPFGPYPKDKLIRKGEKVVEYETPAQTDGFGTDSRLLKNADPIRGVAILIGETPDLLRLSVRVPPNLADLTPTIIQQLERDSGN